MAKERNFKENDQTGGYQICVHVGPAPQVLQEAGLRCVELSVKEASADAVIAALAESPLTAADFRSDALFSIAQDVDRDVAVLCYAALCGFSQKRLDVAVGSRVVRAGDLNDLARAVVDAGKLDPVPPQVQVGSVQHPVLHTVLFSSQISPEDASAVRFARRLRFAPASDPAQALTQFLVVAGMRAKGSLDRFPYLCSGDEEWNEEDPLHIVGICLDTLKDRANELRRGRHAGNRTFLVEPGTRSAREEALIKAATLPIEPVMRWLGARQNEETLLWHCPRPDRHTNGDANASMRAAKGKTRCFRCDGERVDALRLCMDVKLCTPDEAAAWLLAESLVHAGDLEAHAAKEAAASAAASAAVETAPAGDLDELFG